MIKPCGAFSLMSILIYQIKPTIAANRKMLRNILPLLPPNSHPKAIPGFSTKCIRNQFPNTEKSCPMYMFVLIQNLSIWSANRMINTNMAAFHATGNFILF